MIILQFSRAYLVSESRYKSRTTNEMYRIRTQFRWEIKRYTLCDYSRNREKQKKNEERKRGREREGERHENCQSENKTIRSGILRAILSYIDNTITILMSFSRDGYIITFSERKVESAQLMFYFSTRELISRDLVP